MYLLRTQSWYQRRRYGGGLLRRVEALLGRLTVVGVMLTTSVFMTVSVSQACPSERHPAPTLTQNVSQPVTTYVSAVSTVATTAIRDTSRCCGRGSNHCNGTSCAGSCCPAGSGGTIAPHWAAAPEKFGQQVYNYPPQTSRSSADIRLELRPPRLFL